jgi:hypothetical protein
MVVGLGLLGVATSDAALVSVFFGLLQLGFGVAGGLVWLAQRGPKPAADEAFGATPVTAEAEAE